MLKFELALSRLPACCTVLSSSVFFSLLRHLLSLPPAAWIIHRRPTPTSSSARRPPQVTPKRLPRTRFLFLQRHKNGGRGEERDLTSVDEGRNRKDQRRFRRSRSGRRSRRRRQVGKLSRKFLVRPLLLIDFCPLFRLVSSVRLGFRFFLLLFFLLRVL